MLAENFQIHEIQNFDSIFKFAVDDDCEEESLFIYDLDNTVLTYGHDLGTDQWFEHYLRKRISKGMTHQEAKKYTLEQLTRFAETIKDLRPVEPNIPDIIRSFQGRGCQSMILTSRGDYLKQATENQLKDPSINLSFNAGRFKDLEIALEIGNGALLSNGVAYAAGQHKGLALLEILNKINFFPKKIIFIDDKKYNHEQVQSALAMLEQSIELTCLRYGFMDQDVKTLDPKIVRKQLEHFYKKPILSNEEALALWKLEQKHLKLKLGLDFDKAIDTVTIWGNKQSTYNQLISSSLGFEKLLGFPIFGNINGGEPKLCWQFKMSTEKLKTLQEPLMKSGLLQSHQVELLNKITNRPSG